MGPLSHFMNRILKNKTCKNNDNYVFLNKNKNMNKKTNAITDCANVGNTRK